MKFFLYTIIISLISWTGTEKSFAQGKSNQPNTVRVINNYNTPKKSDTKVKTVSPRQVNKNKYTNNATNYPYNAPRPNANRSNLNLWNQRNNYSHHDAVIVHPSENVKIHRNIYDYGRTVTPPSHSRLVYHKGISYRYYDGVYYRPYGNTYVISRPPVGAVVAAVLLKNLVQISIAKSDINHIYYYDDGTYYLRDSTNNYRVIESPHGAVVDMLPSGAMEVRINDVTYYMVGDTYYRPVNIGGYMRFEVVGAVM